jgi:hypothetical protein
MTEKVFLVKVDGIKTLKEASSVNDFMVMHHYHRWQSEGALPIFMGKKFGEADDLKRTLQSQILNFTGLRLSLSVVTFRVLAAKKSIQDSAKTM